MAGPPPTVSPCDVIAVGYRSGDGLEERAVDKRVTRIGAEQIMTRGAAVVGEDVTDRVGEIGNYWVHLDVDVLDETVLPAVTYPQAGGVDWKELASLLRPLVTGPGLIGFSVADLVPRLDPGGTYTTRLTELLVELLSP
jgi:arginase